MKTKHWRKRKQKRGWIFNPRIRLILFLLLVSLGVGILFYPLPYAHVNVSLRARGVTIKTSQSQTLKNSFQTKWLDLGPLAVLEIHDLESKHSLKLEGDLKKEESFFLTTESELEAPRLTLRELFLPENTEISFQLEEKLLHVYIKSSSLRGEFSLQGGRLFIENQQEEKIPLPGFKPLLNVDVLFQGAVKQEESPIHFQLRPPLSWKLFDLSLREFSFAEEEHSGQSDFVSTILSGKVTLQETGKSYELKERDQLTLAGFTPNMRLILSQDLQKGIQVDLEARVEEAFVGPPGMQSFLNPSWLGFLFAKFQPLVWLLIFLLSVAGNWLAYRAIYPKRVEKA